MTKLSGWLRYCRHMKSFNNYTRKTKWNTSIIDVALNCLLKFVFGEKVS